MKKLLPLFLLLAAADLSAQLAGPQSGRSFTTAPLSDADKSWVNLMNAAATDRQYTSFGDLKYQLGSHTDYIVATTFRLNLPSNAQIKGITLYIENYDPDGTTADYSIRIVKRGAIGTADRSTGAAYLGLGDRNTYRTYGGANDVWGETWTPADIMSDDFGVAIAAQRRLLGRPTSGQIDNIRIAVSYSVISTLPLTLTSFTATLQNDNKVRLAWTTTEESGMDRFEVQRSDNAVDFTSFGSLGCRNQRSIASYAYNDYSPLQGVTYYRLKILEKNGSVSYSKVVSVNFNETHAALLYPSPLKQGTALYIHNDNNQKLRIQFYNHTGQLLATASTSNSQVPTDVITKLKGILRYKVIDEKDEPKGSGTLVVY